jgi:hypothetical protein
MATTLQNRILFGGFISPLQEHEVEQRVQAAREKEWEKIVNLEREKVELEEKITEVQRFGNLRN